MAGGGPFDLAPGKWTDDTAMALALADSLISCSGFDTHDLATRFVRWWQYGAYSCTGACFDIGITTREALARFIRTGDPYAGFPDPRNAGNGSLMRLALVAVFAFHGATRADQLARHQSRIRTPRHRPLKSAPTSSNSSPKPSSVNRTCFAPEPGPATRSSQQALMAPGARRRATRSVIRLRHRHSGSRTLGRGHYDELRGGSDPGREPRRGC